MKMEATRSSETSIHFHGTSRRHIAEDSSLDNQCRENLKFNNVKYRLSHSLQ
jgi:hypothetical protein